MGGREEGHSKRNLEDFDGPLISLVSQSHLHTRRRHTFPKAPKHLNRHKVRVQNCWHRARFLKKVDILSDFRGWRCPTVVWEHVAVAWGLI
jgi:hypothetical protein